MRKAIHLPSNSKTIIINQHGDYYEVLLNGDYKTVHKDEIVCIEDKIEFSSFEKIKENVFINCIKNPLSDILYSINSNRLIPEPHQYKPLTKFLNSENSRLLIADEVGLGKTIEAGMIYRELSCRQDLKISLIVVPTSLTLKWQEEFYIRFDENFDVMKTNQFLAVIEEFDNFNLIKSIEKKIIINYHTIRDENVIERLKNSTFEVDFLIMDEAHYFRNEATSTFEGAKILTAIAENILFLSATPVQNHIKDLFNVLSLLDGEYFMDFEYFKKMIGPNKVIHKINALLRNNNSLDEIKKAISDSINENKEVEGISTLDKILALHTISIEERIQFIDELTKADHLSFIINRTKKKDVGRSLPRNAKSVIVDITDAEKNYYDAVIDFVKFIHPNTPQGFITIMPERMASSSMIASYESFKLMRQSGRVFINEVEDIDESYDEIDLRADAIEYLDRILDKGRLIGKYDSKFLKFIEIVQSLQKKGIKQLIVFSFFKYTLNYLMTKLLEFKFNVGIIHGDFSVADRFNKIKSFKKGEFDILLSSEVGSEGLDMQFCNVVINYDLPWNPMRVEQRIGRIDRIGQKFDKLHIFSFCIKGSIEERIFLRLYEKLNIFEGSIGELEPVLGNLEHEINIAEIQNLTNEEIEKKIQLQTMSFKRQEMEIKTQTQELEKLISEDYETKLKQDELLNDSKLIYIRDHIINLIMNFLKSNEIPFVQEKTGNIKIIADGAGKFYKILRFNMCDKRIFPLQYKEERYFLQRLINQRTIKLCFDATKSEDFETVMVNLNHIITKIISKSMSYRLLYSHLSHPMHSAGYAITYRTDLTYYKNKSWIRTLVVDNQFIPIKEYDYFDFIQEASPCERHSIENYDEVKNKATDIVILRVNEIKEVEKQKILYLAKIKENSLINHFSKRITRAKKLKDVVDNQDIKRMRSSEMKNLNEQMELKLQELQRHNHIHSSFELLAITTI